jgi:hypothetical protein
MFDLEAQMSPLFFTKTPFYVVNPKKGNDKTSYDRAPIIQTFLDADTWDEQKSLNWQYYTALQLMLRDGVGIVEMLYARDKRMRRIPTPVYNENTQQWQTRRIKQEVTLFDGVVARPTPLKDFYLLPATAKSIELAFGTGRRIWMYGYQIKAAIERGYFYPEAEVLFGTGGKPRVKRDDTTEGKLGSTQQWDDLYREYTFFEVIMPGRYRNDSDVWEEEELLCLLDRETYTPLRFELPDPSKKKKYKAFNMIPRPNQFLGWGVPELAMPIVEEYNAIGNNALDTQAFNLNLPLFTTPGNLIDKDLPVGPGTIHMVNNVEELRWPDPRDIPPSIPQTKGELLQMLDKVLGTADISSLLASGGSRQTRTQIMALAQGIAGRIQVFSNRISKTLGEIGSYHLELQRRYGPDTLNFASREPNGQKMGVTISKEDLQADVVVFPNGSIKSFDQAQKEQAAYFRLQMLIQSPFAKTQGPPNPQTGQPTESWNWSRVYAMFHDFLTAQDCKDIDSLIGKEEELPKMAQQQGGPAAIQALMAAAKQGMGGGNGQGNGQQQGAGILQ